jgi:hypothetical protein
MRNGQTNSQILYVTSLHHPATATLWKDFQVYESCELNHHLFQSLLSETDAEHKVVLYHPEV